MTIYTWILVGCWFVFLTYWLVSAFSAKKNIGGIWRWFIWRAILVIVVLWFFNVQIFSGNLRPPKPSSSVAANIIGVLLCVAGTAFAIWARAHIGRNWGMPMSVKENPELVTSGPYKYVRHPIYTGVILALVGSGLIAGPVWFISVVIGGAYFIFSAKAEEKLMTKQFPNEYPAYKKRTKMLIPFVF